MSMTRTEHLLTILAEECAEVAQRASKALRFTLEEVQPGQGLTNAERIVYEFRDLQAVMELLEEEGALPSIWVRDEEAIDRKKRKVELFLCHSFDVGTMGEEGIKPLPKCGDRCDDCLRRFRCINAGVLLPRKALTGIAARERSRDGVVECPNCMGEGVTGAGVCSVCKGERKITQEEMEKWDRL